MRSQRNLTILGIICLSLILRADSCLLEQKKVHMVIPAEVPFQWETKGHTEATDTRTYSFDAAGPVRDGLSSDSIPGDLLRVYLAGAQYRVVESTGHDARRVGSVTIEFDVAAGPGHGTGPFELLTFDVPSNATGVSGSAGDGTVTLVAAGLGEINYRLGEWLDAYKANPLDTSLDGWLRGTGTATWSSTPAPSAADPDDFTWVTDAVIQVVKEGDVEAPK